MGLTSAPIAKLLPHDPIGRRGRDGRPYRVIPINRHLLPFPEIVHPSWSWRAGCDFVAAFGHPEVAFTMQRIEALLDDPNRLTEREITHLRMFDAVLPVAFEPVREAIAARFPAGCLLPVFGHWATLAEVQSAFRERGGRGEVYRAICFLNSVTVVLDLIEARLAPVAANGNVPFDFRGGE
jgi:hypothetical protein